MNVLRQLLRQPVRTLALLLLLTAASAFLCLNFGVMLSARATANELESQFHTIALPNAGKERSGNLYQDVLTPADWEQIYLLPETCPSVERLYQQTFVSAWSPELTTLVSAQEDGRYSWSLDKPYHAAAFVVTITDLEDGSTEDDLSHGSTRWEITAKVEETVLLHPGYTPRAKLHISYSTASSEDAETAALKVGGRYLVYGSYIDSELRLRTSLAGDFNCGTDEINWDNITDEGVEEFKEETRRQGYGDASLDEIAAWYRDALNGRERTLTKNDLDQIGSGRLIVQNRGAQLSGDVCLFDIDGSPNGISAAEALSTATISPLDTDVEHFLSRPENRLWVTTLSQAGICQQCAPVIGTDLLEGIYLFQQKDAVIVDGGSFSEEDYRSGAKKCLISEQMALASGLSVGDAIDLSFYWGAEPSSGIDDIEADLGGLGNPAAQEYCAAVGFAGEAEPYTIAGVYRLSSLWDTFPYAFSPNTVFAPNKALPENRYHVRHGNFVTLALKNGEVGAVKEAASGLGLPDNALVYFDSGYLEFSDTLRSFQENASRLFAVACMTWLAIMLVYLALFVRHQRRTAGLMLSLGSGKRRAEDFVFSISILPVLLASLTGAGIGALMMNTTVQSVFRSSSDDLATTFSASSASGHAALEQALTTLPAATVFAALLQILLFSAVIFISAKHMARQAPRGLMCTSQ